MKVLAFVLLAASLVDCQTKNQNGNPTGGKSHTLELYDLARDSLL